jgi:hypothetical protein
MPCPLVSVHGGHSGDYCQHARDSLDDVVKAYHDRKFAWVGITEHMPPTRDSFLYPDYILGSVHLVTDIPIDMNPSEYAFKIYLSPQAVQSLGSSAEINL